jgi:hypothetical protein
MSPIVIELGMIIEHSSHAAEEEQFQYKVCHQMIHVGMIQARRCTGWENTYPVDADDNIVILSPAGRNNF